MDQSPFCFSGTSGSRVKFVGEVFMLRVRRLNRSSVPSRGRSKDTFIALPPFDLLLILAHSI
jgi:hypothetical protein